MRSKELVGSRERRLKLYGPGSAENDNDWLLRYARYSGLSITIKSDVRKSFRQMIWNTKSRLDCLR